MPWCPRCDEVFPEGPACPRCSARLLDGERGGTRDGTEAMPDVAPIKVSRRYRRAFERLSGPKAPSARALWLAIASLVFAVGFLLGRVGSVVPSDPTLRALPSVRALSHDDVRGSASYLLWTDEALTTVAVQELYTGSVSPRARFTPPTDVSDDAKTAVVTLGRSVAVVLDDGERSFVAFSADGGTPHGWIPGVAAAWSTPDELLIRQADGTVVVWSSDTHDLHALPAGRADKLFQTSSGAVLERNNALSKWDTTSDEESLDVPEDGRVLAVAADGRRALIDRSGPVVWDAKSPTRVDLKGYHAVGASFAPGGDRVAVVLQRGDELSLAIVDEQGNAALKPLDARTRGCAPTPAWDRQGKWVYVSVGDGVLYAIEADGGRVESVRTRSAGCGVAWLDGDS